jgi:photosystem II stability/assembly factor-like uncharacterized protein
MRFVSTAPPSSRASGAGPTNLAFVSPRVGFAATTGGFRFVGRLGLVSAVDRGRIERTDDGGATWRTLWSAPDVVFTSITVSGRSIAALGHKEPGTPDAMGRFEPRTARWLVLASSDGGRTWRRLAAPSGGGVLEALTPRAWVFARPLDTNNYPVRRTVAYRSTDAGRQWQRLVLPRDTLYVRFATPVLGFAGARGQECPRMPQLWRTSDGGRTWRSVAGTCGPPLVDLDVVSPHVLFAAQSQGEYPGPARSVVSRSMDGGRSWRVLWREHGREIVRLAFADSRRGFAVDRRWRPGAGGGYYCPRLRATTDAGRTWGSRTLPYYDWVCQGAAGAGPQAPSAFVGTQHAWAGDEGAGVVWRTSDGARSWRVSAESRSLGFMQLTRRELAATDDRVTVQTAAGPASSNDGGETWTLSGWPSEREIALAQRRGAYLATASDSDRSIPMVTPDGGRTWRRLRLPGLLRGRAGDVAFTSPRDGLVTADVEYGAKLAIFATHDGGRTWRQIQLPAVRDQTAGATLGPGIAVVTPFRAQPLITTDEGRTWRPLALTADYCEIVARPSRDDIWMQCGILTNPSVALLTSHDAGATWTLRRGRLFFPKLAVVGGREAWAVSDPYSMEATRAGTPDKLWHTTDAGATWQRVWVSLSPTARTVTVTLG